MNSVSNAGIDVAVYANGRPMRIYSHEGKFFLESRVGTEYSIEIKNNTWQRVEAVVSVDGLSVISGEDASLNDTGYVINSFDSIKIKGFRKDMAEVGAFKFSQKYASYASASKGKPQNVGVISFAVWTEKEKPLSQILYRHPVIGWPQEKGGSAVDPDFWNTGTITCGGTSTSAGLSGRIGASGSAGVTASANYCSSVNTSVNTSSTLRSMTTELPVSDFAEPSHGTTWGSKLTDHVTTTTFERGYLLVQNSIFYNSKQQLESMGIKMVSEKMVRVPNGFPATFATPPAGWP